MAEATPRDRAEFAFARMVEAAIVRLPRGAAATLGSNLGRTVGARLGVRWSTVLENLRRAFPEADEGWVEDVARRSYEHLGREAIEMVRLSHRTREEIVELTDVDPEPLEVVRRSTAAGRGALLVTGHYGNWELAAAAVAARGIPLDAIVRRQRNPLIDARLEGARRRLGMQTIDMVGAPKLVVRSLLEGRCVGIVGDQDARKAGVFVPFFGIPSSTYKGPAMFALKFGAPVFASIARRLPDGRYRVEARQVDATPTGDAEADVRRVTAELAAHLEVEIRKDPGQYFWFHRRWKTRPPEEL